MNERISLTPKIMELSNTNDIFMTMDLRILSSTVNLNNAMFSEEFIFDTVKNKQDIIGIPFVVDKDSLEKGEYSNLTHQLSSDGELKTDQIGSFVDFWTDKDEEGVLYLAGRVRIMKRFKETCEAINKLYLSGNLSSSCEVLVSSYDETSDDGVRVIGYNDGKNRLFASCLVSNPADVKAKPMTLIAEAYKQDLSEQSGGNKMSKTEKESRIVKYNNGIKISTHGTLNVSGEAELSDSLTWHDVEKEIYNLLNPQTEDGREYNYWIRDLYVDYAILSDDNRSSVYYKAGYKIEGKTVVVDSKEDWIKGTIGFIPDSADSKLSLGGEDKKKIKEYEDELNELQKELSELKEEKNNMSKEQKNTEKTTDELMKEIASLRDSVDDLKEKIVTAEGEKVELEEKITEFQEEIAELAPYKEQVEKTEKEAVVAQLKEKYSKLLSEEVMKSETVVKAIEENDVVSLNDVVVQEISKKAATEDVEEPENKAVEIAAKETGELVELSAKDYLFSARK